MHLPKLSCVSDTGSKNRRSQVRSPACPISSRGLMTVIAILCNPLPTLSFVSTLVMRALKQPVALRERYAEYAYWRTKLQENMDSCTGPRVITDIMLKTALNTTIQSVNQIPSTVNFLQRICDCHCNMIHSSLITVLTVALWQSMPVFWGLLCIALLLESGTTVHSTGTRIWDYCA